MSGAEPEAIGSLMARHPALAACKEEIAAAQVLLIRAYEGGRKVLLCGNGGSAADCEHIAGELLKGFERARPLPRELRARLAKAGPEGEKLAGKLQCGLPAVSLTGHPSFASAFANDVEPAMVFAQLVTALGGVGDVLMAISTSGQARNIIFAVHAARAMGMSTIGLSGMGGGDLGPLCDVCVVVPAESTPEVQELHVPVYHYLCRAVEAHFFPE